MVGFLRNLGNLTSNHPPIRYGPSLYLIFPSCAPLAGTAELSEVQRILPQIEAGEGRSVIACKSP